MFHFSPVATLLALVLLVVLCFGHAKVRDFLAAIAWAFGLGVFGVFVYDVARVTLIIIHQGN